jgi:hypothetical protein
MSRLIATEARKQCHRGVGWFEGVSSGAGRWLHKSGASCAGVSSPCSSARAESAGKGNRRARILLGKLPEQWLQGKHGQGLGDKFCVVNL